MMGPSITALSLGAVITTFMVGAFITALLLGASVAAWWLGTFTTVLLFDRHLNYCFVVGRLDCYIVAGHFDDCIVLLGALITALLFCWAP